MYTRIFIQPAAAAFVVVAALSFPHTARAINIGEVVSQSRLGEPLHTQIELTGTGAGVVDDACLSLIVPDRTEEDARNFLTDADLSIKAEGKRQFIIVSSDLPFNEPFFKVRLQLKCVGVGSIVKTFTILPDFIEVKPIAAPVVAAEPGIAAASGSSGKGMFGTKLGAIPLVAEDRLPEPRETPSRRSKHHVAAREGSGEDGQLTPTRRLPPVRSAQGKGESVRLRLSGASLDESRIGKISQEERRLLLARQKLLDADDQMASFLALQHQVKQLQDELGMVKLKLAQIGVSAPAAAPSLVSAQPSTEAAAQPSPEAVEQPAAEEATQPSGEKQEIVQEQQAPAKQKRQKTPRGLIILGLLGLLGLLLGLRAYLRIRSQSAGPKPVLKRPAMAPVAVHEPIFNEPVSVAEPPETFARPAPPKRAEPAASSPAHERTREELSDAEAIIEEAELYAIHGHPDRAALILKDLIREHPDKTEAWMLLFSIYSSLKKADEFGKTAQEFIKANKDSASWPEIQALGRALDPENKLYAGAEGVAAPQAVLGKRALLGDILLAMGALSMDDMQKCLGEFDPKIDGRFGGFLVRRHMITEAQLNAALQQQQAASEPSIHQAEAASKAGGG